ncbi:MAG: hypothetical protein HY665_07275 [Chloroflexi bacterium]|nr:hypothetical protein [Chloroflexota bacterium]
MRRNLYLLLTIVCFLGLVAIFVVDGYLGVYDFFTMNIGERIEQISPDYWQRQTPTAPNDYFLSAARNDKVFFQYEVDNRLSSNYKANVEVSIWQSQQKVRDLVQQEIDVPAFGKQKLEWTIDTSQFRLADDREANQFSIIVKRGDVQRRIVMFVNPIVIPIKPIPTPEPVR